MGRTTTEKKGNTVILRISDDLKREIEDYSKASGQSVSEYIREILQDSITKKSARKNSVIQNKMDEGRYNDLERMCELSGLTVDKFMGYIVDYFNNGQIYIEGIAVRTRGRYDTRGLEEACHRVNVDPQEMIDRLSRSLMRG